MATWTQEDKDLAVKLYTEICENEHETDEQRAENATAIVSRVAEQIEKTLNGTRIQLSKAGVYIAQKPKASAAKAGAAKSAGTKLSKADQIQALKDNILAATPEGTELDDTVLDKLTGKAAAHLAELFLATQGE
jgi:hypothetical protein